MINNIGIYSSFIIFFIGLFGAILSKKNFIKFIISIEVMILSAILIFALSSLHFTTNTVYMIILPITVIEIAVCISIIIHRKEE